MGEVNNCFQRCIPEYVLMKCLLISVSISYTCVKVLSPPFTGIHFHNLLKLMSLVRNFHLPSVAPLIRVLLCFSVEKNVSNQLPVVFEVENSIWRWFSLSSKFSEKRFYNISNWTQHQRRHVIHERHSRV